MAPRYSPPSARGRFPISRPPCSGRRPEIRWRRRMRRITKPMRRSMSVFAAVSLPRARSLAVVWTTLAVATLSGQAPDYRNPDLPFDVRVNDLVARMTLEEKVSQMQDVAPAIDRLGIPAYNWWNEAL